MYTEYFEFYSPVKINSGKNALDGIVYELNLLGVSNPLLITDAGIKNAGLLEILLKVLSDSGLNLLEENIFDQVPSDSSIETVNEIARIFKHNNNDALIALGGGSVIDTAKGVNILVSTGNDDLHQLMGVDRISAKLYPLVVIPTTSGTGSEATLVAVVADKTEKLKLPFVSYQIVPTLAVLDPRMTISLPPMLTASTGMDALTHAIEAYTCLQKNPISDAFAWKAIELIRQNLIPAVAEPKDIDAKLAMANASLMAGIAFSNSMVGAVHAIGHALGAVANLHHGTAMAILLPAVMEKNIQQYPHLYDDLLLPLAGAYSYSIISENERSLKAIEQIRQLNEQLRLIVNMPVNLTAAGVDKNVFDLVAEKAINDGSMSTNPVDFNKEQIIEILNSVS